MRDARTGERFELAIDPEQALDAFRHPFAHAARRGLLSDGPANMQAVEQALVELEEQTLSFL